MAGRKPRNVPDDALAPDGPPRGQPYRFQPGNRHGTARATTGLTSKRVVDDKAHGILIAFLSDPRCPEYLRSTAFAPDAMAWSRKEAMAALAFDWMAGLYEEGGPEAVFGLKPGLMRSPSEIWLRHEEGAARARNRLGITPSSYAAISRDLGIAQSATEDRLNRMAKEGRTIAAERMGIAGRKTSQDEEGDAA